MPRPLTPVALAAALVAPAAFAQWPDDPSANLFIANAPADEILPKIGASPDGSCWIGWFESVGGAFVVKVQRLDADGNPTLGAEGLLVSNHPQQSFLTDWDLIADSQGGCALVFSDIRDGGDLDVQAYRILADGSFAWGDNGLQLSSNTDFEASPRICETSDGQFVAVWGRSPSGSVPGDIRMQRLTAEGVTLLGPGGMAVVGPTGVEKPGFCDVVPSLGGSVIVSWLRDTATFPSPRHLRAMRYDVAGSNMWTNPTSVFDQGSLPIGYYPRIIEDGSGGAVLAWHASVGNQFNAYAQRLDPSGVEQFAHNGVEVVAVPGEYEMSPAVAFDASSNEIWMVYHRRNTTQNQWGTSAQIIDASGARKLGPSGKVLAPLDAFEDRSPQVTYAQGSNEIVAVWMDFPTGSIIEGRVIATRMAADGSFVYGTPPSMAGMPGFVAVSTPLASRDDIEVALDNCGRTLAVWQDNRNGNADAVAQNINRNGTLGDDCREDVNGDGVVGFPDLNTLLGVYGEFAAPGALPGDIDCNGTVGFPDLNLLLGMYGMGC